LFSRQPDIALHQLDTRVAQALCELGRVSINSTRFRYLQNVSVQCPLRPWCY